MTRSLFPWKAYFTLEPCRTGTQARREGGRKAGESLCLGHPAEKETPLPQSNDGLQIS